MDLEKFKYYKFNDNRGIDYKIKVLLLKFEFEVDKMGLNEEDQILLLEDWIEKFNALEFYEYLKPFKQRKALLQSNVIFQSEINVDSVESKIYRMTFKERIKTFFKSFF